MPVKNRSNELKLTRVYDAPVEMVWDAWVDPTQVAQWWGPRGFTLTTHSKDLRPGGSWVYTMHGPDGTDYPNKTIYHEVEECARLVYDHGANDDRPALFRVTVEFTEKNGKTKMDMTMTLPTPEAAEEIGKFIKKAGGNSTWDRLAEYLEKDMTGKEKFVINRSFEAPADVVFRMWTDPEHFSQWLPPTGLTMQSHRAEVNSGGSLFFSMSAPGESKMYGKINYLKIDAPHLIVYTQQFCDEHEELTRYPAEPHWPETMLMTVQLSEEGPGKTRVTVTCEAYGEVAAEEITTFAKAKGSMTQGWTGSFDKLEELLSGS